MPRNVIFDLDGTLIDSLPGIQWSVDASLAACGAPPREVDLKPLIGPPIRRILSAVVPAAGETALDQLERAFRQNYDSEGWKLSTTHPGTEALLERLHAAGLRLWVVTNKPALATGMILVQLGIAHFFFEIACSDSQPGRRLSKAENLTAVLDRHAIRNASLMVGDTAEDYEAATRAGIPCLIVGHGYGKDLDLLPPDVYQEHHNWDDVLERCNCHPPLSNRNISETAPSARH